MNAFRAGLNLRQNLLAAGIDDRELRRRRRTGEIAAVRPGAYVIDGLASDAEARHRFAVEAAAVHLGGAGSCSATSRRRCCTGCRSGRSTSTVSTRRGTGDPARTSRLLHLHAAALEPDEVVAVDGLLVTSLPRTLVDLARTLPFEQALVPADAAMRTHRVTRAELDEAVDLAAGRPGNSVARQVLAFARPGATNPGESRSRLAIHRAGLPPPVLQHQIRTAGGLFLGDVDFWWEEFDTVGEFDGRMK